MTSHEVTSLGERDDVTGGDVTRRGDEDVPGAGNYVARNYIVEVCGNLRPQ